MLLFGTYFKKYIFCYIKKKKMNEGELLEMGRNLIQKNEELDLKEKNNLLKWSKIHKELMTIYAFAKELDMLTENQPGFPMILKYLIERIRGVSSTLCFPEPSDVEILNVTFELFDGEL